MNDYTEFMRGYEAAEFTREMEFNFRVYRALRLAGYVGAALVAAVVFLGLCSCLPALAADDAAEAEYEGLEAAYAAEMLDGSLRAARLRDNGEPVDASAWRIASEAPAIRKGDAE